MFCKMRLPIAATAFMLAASVACASSAAQTDYWSNAAWYVGDYSDDNGPSCGLGTQDQIEGRAPLITFVFMFRDKTLISFQNSDWSITEGERYTGMSTAFSDANDRITANYNGADYTGGQNNMLMLYTEADILDSFAQNRTLTAFRTGSDNDTVVVAKVDLRGSAEGIAKLRECHQAASARFNAAAERERVHPKNPFAR